MKPIIMLFEDLSSDRYDFVKQAAIHLNYDIFPSDFDRGFYIKKVDEWINLIIDRASNVYVLVDQELGRNSSEDTLTRNDIIEIINSLKINQNLIGLFPGFLDFVKIVCSDREQTEWNYQLALIIMKIATELRCKACASCTSLTYVSLNFKDKLDMENQPAILKVNSERSVTNWVNKINTNNSLENLWEKTYGMDIHDRQNLIISNEFSKFTGFNIDFNSTYFRDALKSMTGRNAIAGGGERATSILSIYFLLMGAVKDQTSQPLQSELMNIAEVNIIAESSFLPIQELQTAKNTLNVIFKLFCKLVVFKEGHIKQDQLCLLNSSVSCDGVRLYLEIDSAALNQGIKRAVTGKHRGDVSSLILEYASLAGKENSLDSIIEIRPYQDNYTELLLKPYN
jgi:hypothetical protein